jgi:cytochrome c-type biogenesis protein CcmH
MQDKQKRFIISLIVITAGLVLFSAPPVAAQNSTPTPEAAQPTATPPVSTGSITDDQVNIVAQDLYCPICSNVPLDVCGTQSCADWRELIRQKLADGWTADQIKMYFLQRYGDQVLPVPPNPLIFIIPAVFIVFGGGIFLSKVLTPRRKAQQAVPAPAQPPVNDPYIARLEAELEKRKKTRR